MFGLKKKPASVQEGNKDTNTINIAGIPIHTMQDDLEKIKNPNAIITPAKKQTTPSSKQNTSPFFTPAIENSQTFSQPESNSTSAKMINTKSNQSSSRINKSFNATNRTDTPSHEDAISNAKNYANAKFDKRFMILSALSIALLVLLAIAGLRFFKNKTATVDETPTTPIEQEPTQPIQTPAEDPAPIPKPALSFSETNPNYLRLEDGIAVSDKIKATLGQVSQEGYTLPVEFIITDSQNKPISFKNFSDLLAIKLSQSTFNSLGDNFSLFIYNDATGPKIGLTIESKNDIDLGKSLTQEEPLLADEINPLFLNNTYNKAKLFNSSEYGGVKIRYQNIISPEMLSVDYSIFKNKLLIGTTKLTMRAIIDKLNNTALNKPSETLPATMKETTGNQK